jgi:hypothetical protein
MIRACHHHHESTSDAKDEAVTRFRVCIHPIPVSPSIPTVEQQKFDRPNAPGLYRPSWTRLPGLTSPAPATTATGCHVSSHASER